MASLAELTQHVSLSGHLREDMVAFLTQHGCVATVGHSVRVAAWCYLDDLWQRRASLAVVHPWLAEAHRWLSARI